ncbi:MAG: hypothetical protein AUK60_07065 [Rhodobacteraceae bacterium CG2_30_10_405]|nr:MAG: hypothetical protein AUK60_07065 [Rhodobacteraceae bacterium CG2_30_10_405]
MADVAALQETLRRLAREHDVLRVKGYAAVTGKPMRLLVQAVGERVQLHYDRPWGAETRATRLVAIAERADLDAVAIRAVPGA